MRPLLLGLLVLVFQAATASAQINLSWKNCIGVGTGLNTAVSNIQYACDGSLDGVPQRFVFSFIPPIDMPQYVGTSVVVDVEVPSPALPDYWRLGLGECRDGVLAFPASMLALGNTTSCRNPYSGTTGGGYQWDSAPVGWGSNRARLHMAIADVTERSLTAGQHYMGGAGSIDPVMDLGSGECTGCQQSACFVLNRVELYQTLGAPGGDIILMTPDQRNVMLWQGCPTGPIATRTSTVDPCWIDCPVPTQSRTWGSIKSLYR